MYFMILKDIRATHMVLIPMSLMSPSFARVPLTHGLQLLLYKTDAIELCHLYHHLNTQIPPWESQARYVFQHNGFSGPFIESISHGPTQSQSGFKRDAVNFVVCTLGDTSRLKETHQEFRTAT